MTCSSAQWLDHSCRLSLAALHWLELPHVPDLNGRGEYALDPAQLPSNPKHKTGRLSTRLGGSRSLGMVLCIAFEAGPRAAQLPLKLIALLPLIRNARLEDWRLYGRPWLRHAGLFARCAAQPRQALCNAFFVACRRASDRVLFDAALPPRAASARLAS